MLGREAERLSLTQRQVEAVDATRSLTMRTCRRRRHVDVTQLEVLRLDPLAHDEDHRAADRVPELADVPRPGMALEHAPGLAAHAANLNAVPATMDRDEVLDEERDVLAPRAKWRHLQNDLAQPIVQVGEEFSLADRTLEILVGGRDEPHVHARRRLRADRPHLSLLDRAEQHRLALEREVADLVGEQRAAVGDGEEPWSALEGAGEGAALMTEELAGEKLAGEGRAVDLDVGGATPATQLLEGVGNALALAKPP